MNVTAAALVSRLSAEIIAAAGARRMASGRMPRPGDGESAVPAPASLAAAAVMILPIDFGGEKARAAVRRVPRCLACYARHDGRRLVVDAYADAVEVIGAARGQDLAPDQIRGSSGVRPDGGASAKVAQVSRARAMAAMVDKFDGPGGFGPGVALAPRRADARGGVISTRALWDGVAIEGRDLAEILRAHGWRVKDRPRAILSAAFAALVHDMADAFGFSERLAAPSVH